MNRPINLVMIFVIGLLAGGVGLAGVQRVRQAANRMQCAQHLKQLGLGIHNYEGVYQHFPPTFHQHNGEPALPGRRLSWIYELWPYMGDGWESWVRPEKGWDAAENDRLRKEAVSLFRCPSNRSIRDSDGSGLSHFVGVTGIGESAAMLPVTDRFAGAFGTDRRVQFEDVTDGLENTIVIIETTFQNGAWLAEGHSTSRGLVPERQPYIGLDQQFFGRHVYGGIWRFPRPATNMLFGDGTVKSIAPEISPRVLEALATIGGGESGATGVGDE